MSEVLNLKFSIGDKVKIISDPLHNNNAGRVIVVDYISVGWFAKDDNCIIHYGGLDVESGVNTFVDECDGELFEEKSSLTVSASNSLKVHDLMAYKPMVPVQKLTDPKDYIEFDSLAVDERPEGKSRGQLEWNSNCPVCKAPAHLGLSNYECSDPNCDGELSEEEK